MSKVIQLRNIKRALTLKPDQLVSYRLSGRVSNLRPYKTFNFVDLVDGSTRDHLQVIIPRDTLKKPELGSYVTCRGHLVQSPGSKQNLEFKVEELEYLGTCDPQEYPLANAPDQSASGWYRHRIHLRPRAANFASLVRVRSELELGLHMIMKQMDFFRVHTPCLTSNDSEASSDLFTVQRTKLYGSKESDKHDDDEEDCSVVHDSDDCELSRDSSARDENHRRIVRDGYFKKNVFLVTSSQLHLENLAASLSRVYTLTTAFRAENSLTRRHLCEFLMFEAEEANLTQLEPLMDRVESIIKFIAQFLTEVSEHKADFNYLLDTHLNNDDFKKVAYEPYVRMTYNEALDILRNKSDFQHNTEHGTDIGRLHERKLLEHCNNHPIFITNYPKQLKPFYMKCDMNDNNAQCFDLIAPLGGEICGGSLREDSWDKLRSNLSSTKSEEELEQFNWYLDLRRFGSFPHGGFGIGIERLLQSLLGIKNIKDTTAFPRWAGHCPM